MVIGKRLQRPDPQPPLLPLVPFEQYARDDLIVAQLPEPTEPEQPEPPCGPVAGGPTPSGVDLNKLRRAAQAAGRALDQKRNGNEWGILIYRTPTGTLRATSPQIIKRKGEIGYNFNRILPQGSVLVAEEHSHTREPGVSNQEGLSDEDVDGRQTIMDTAAQSGGRFTVNPNFLSYIYDLRNRTLSEFYRNSLANRPGSDVTSC